MLLKNIINYKLLLNLKNSKCYSKFAYVHQPGREALLYRNLGQQIERAVDKFGSQIAIKCNYEQQQLSFEDSYKEALNLAVKLEAIELKKGDHVAIWAPNTIQWYTTFLASAIGGYPLVCINPSLEVPELEFMVKKAKVKCLVTMESCGKLDFRNKIQQLRKANRVLENTLFVIMKSDRKVDQCLSYDDLLEKKCDQKKLDDMSSRMLDIAPESSFAVQFTSGTTGQPKAALLSHFNAVNQAVHMGRTLRLDSGDKSICLTVPMFHVFGLSILLSSLHYGSTVCLPAPTFNAVAALETIQRDQCTVVVGTPTMFVDMVENQLRLQRKVDSLDVALMGGAACSPELIMQIKEVLNPNNMFVGYGLTEAAGAVSAHDGSETTESSYFSVGKLFGNSEAKVVDEKGNTLKFGEVGELCLRGWFTMVGYFEDELNTCKAVDAKGWLKTGDLFVLESNGVARYQGRRKDVIIRGGENIFPKEIEDFLNQHASVLESHVIGIPDPRLGEEICVYMRLKQDAERLTEEDIKKFCKGKLAYFKIPKYVRIVDDFPKTTSGKIQKFKLLETFKTEMEIN